MSATAPAGAARLFRALCGSSRLAKPWGAQSYSAATSKTRATAQMRGACFVRAPPSQMCVWPIMSIERVPNDSKDTEHNTAHAAHSTGKLHTTRSTHRAARRAAHTQRATHSAQHTSHSPLRTTDRARKNAHTQHSVSATQQRCDAATQQRSSAEQHTRACSGCWLAAASSAPAWLRLGRARVRDWVAHRRDTPTNCGRSPWRAADSALQMSRSRTTAARRCGGDRPAHHAPGTELGPQRADRSTSRRRGDARVA